MICLFTWKIGRKRQLEMHRILGLWKKSNFQEMIHVLLLLQHQRKCAHYFSFYYFFQAQDAYTKQAVENSRRDFRTKMSSGYIEHRVLVFQEKKEAFLLR